MRLRGWIVASLMVCTPLALTQSGTNAAPNDRYVPRLGDIMNAVQSRHMKLWFAGGSLNWPLAAYELEQLRAGLMEAASLYSGIPVTNVTTMADLLQSVSDAIAAKDARQFSKAVGALTDGCNACHQSMDRGYIVMRAPAVSPFSDQIFAPQGKH
jgi:hypothetical protein